MSLNPKDLSAEERAIVDSILNEFRKSTIIPDDDFASALEEAEPIIVARRKFYAAPAQPEPKVCENCGQQIAYAHLHTDSWMDKAGCAKTRYVCRQKPEPKRNEMPCPNCKKPISSSTEHILLMHEIPYPRYTCQPAPSPAPVAGELAEAVRNAITLLRSFGPGKPLCWSGADALEAWARSQEKQHRFEIKTLEAKYDNERVLRERNARSQAQPVAVGMSEELEWVLSLANDAALKHDDFCRNNSAGNPAYSARVRAAIAAVRAQAASAQLGRDLPKVRGYFDSLANLPQYQNAEGRSSSRRSGPNSARRKE